MPLGSRAMTRAPSRPTSQARTTMDADTSQDRRPGGTVEPANRAAMPKQPSQAPWEPEGERYELRDPFAEVTYRAKSLDEVVVKAERLGATRFTAIAPDGKRTPMQKVDGQWQRTEGHAPEADAASKDNAQRT